MVLTQEQAEQIREKLLEQVKALPEDQRESLRQQVMSATPEQLEAYQKPADGNGSSSGGECLFCGIAKGNVETVKVYEDSSVVAFLDITPNKPGQVIISTKEHYQFIFQIPDQILWDMVRVMKMLMPLVINATSATGVSVYIAQGPGAGQIMEHISINLIPRFEGDKAVFVWDRKQADKSELEKIGKEIYASVEKTLKEEKEKVKSKMQDKVAEEKEKKDLAGTEVSRMRP